MNTRPSEALIESIREVCYRPDCVDSPEDDLRDWLVGQGWSCRTWTDAPNTNHPPHDHPYSHRVFCVSGWIEFTTKNETYRLEPGDALDLPERVEHGAVTSPDGPTEYWLLRPR